MNKQQLAAKIWESANQMRSKIEANVRIPYQTGRPVHGKLDTDSSAKWTVIPRQTGQ